MGVASCRPRERGDPYTVYYRETAEYGSRLALPRSSRGSLGRDDRSRMPLNAEKLLALQNPRRRAHATGRRTASSMRWAWARPDPLNRDELAFVYEKNLKVAADLRGDAGLCRLLAARCRRSASPGKRWCTASTASTLHAPVAPQGTVIGRTRILDVVDKGEGKGALVYSSARSSTRRAAACSPRLTQTTFCRGDGGFGGPKRDTPPPHALP